MPGRAAPPIVRAGQGYTDMSIAIDSMRRHAALPAAPVALPALLVFAWGLEVVGVACGVVTSP